MAKEKSVLYACQQVFLFNDFQLLTSPKSKCTCSYISIH